MSVHITQGTFSYLPPLTDGEIGAQVQYGIDRAWMVSIEFTDDPHPRNVYWHLWGMPMFDLLDAAAVLSELNRCREAVGSQYVRLSLYDPSLGRQTTALQFMVHRPAKEPGYRLDRAYAGAREVRYTMHPYASDRPHGSRYP